MFRPLIDRLGVLFDPRFWLRNYGVSHEWDAALGVLLDMVEDGQLSIEQSDHTVTIGGVTVWVSNWPYAYGRAHRPIKSEMIPRRSTALRLRRVAAIAAASNAISTARAALGKAVV